MLKERVASSLELLFIANIRYMKLLGHTQTIYTYFTTLSLLENTLI
jgi:hypothetical protein